MKRTEVSGLSLIENHNLSSINESNKIKTVSETSESEALIFADKEQVDPLNVAHPNCGGRERYVERKIKAPEYSQLLRVQVKENCSSGNEDKKKDKHLLFPPREKEKHLLFPPNFQIYISHFLSSWGDRMWMFAGGLFLIEITPGSLRLVAIYEAANSLTIIFFGSAVGRWVDRTSRLTAAQSSLVLQNFMVCACTILLCLMTLYKSNFNESLNGWGNTFAEAGVIVLSCLAQIGSLGSKLAIEKDWIVVISEQYSDMQLSTMNSVLRTVDLSTKILAPVLVGFVMTSAGMIVGGIFIGAWNLISFLVEYSLLRNLYYGVSSLQNSKQEKTQHSLEGEKIPKGFKEKVKDAGITWKLYFKHSVRDAGLGLAILYMTVLAMDNFSRAYVHENGVSKGTLGILTALASLSGISGSIAFPFVRRKIGPLKTGIFGFTYQTTCLLFCLASVFAPGSPFDPLALFNCGNSTNVTNVDISSRSTNHFLSIHNINLTTENTTLSFYNNTEEYTEPFNGELNQEGKSSNYIYTSVILFLFGIITSRFGLWLADLTVTQILQEDVAENERCGISGVQNSLNQFFSLVRSILIIILPTVPTFGFLVILSFTFVLLATILFVVYSKRKMNVDDLVK